MNGRRVRCLLVALGLLAGGTGAATLLLREAAAPVGSVDAAVVQLCLVLLLGCTGWATASGLAAVAEAWRGAPRAASRGVLRRLVLAACGVAVTVSCVAVTGAAHAIAHNGTHDSPHDGPLDGLPLPERATDGPRREATPRVVVRAGDTLWSLAAARLPHDATDAEVGAGWRRLYAANRVALGPDPGLIHPGQVLDLPHTEENR